MSAGHRTTGAAENAHATDPMPRTRLRVLPQMPTPPRIPFLRPNPPGLSTLGPELAEIERSGVFSNNGPVNRRFEERMRSEIFGGEGACLTVCNATIGLMLAIRHAVGWAPRGRYALMPSFTFAATAHAALWCGLTPLLVDIDPQTWLPDPQAEARLLDRYGAEVALLLPNATFGNCLDLGRYADIARQRGTPVVVDAAASLGSIDVDGRAFGAGFAHPMVFSMHATKSFATSEAGLLYCADADRIATLRIMGNFGFGEPRSATMPGLNAKLPEVTALQGEAKLAEFETVAAHRDAMYALYRELLRGFGFQRLTGRRTAHQFVPVLLPEALAGRVPEVIASLAARGVGAGRYFAPHLAQQPYFASTCTSGPLPATEATCARIISLPLSDRMTPTEVRLVCEAMRRACRQVARGDAPRRAHARP